MDTLTTTLDAAAAYQVVTVAEPAAAGWLHLPSLHAKLLPLALAAGHTRLTIRCEVGGPGPGTPLVYEAFGSGGAVEWKHYVVAGTAESVPADFERVLEERLVAQVGQGVTICQL